MLRDAASVLHQFEVMCNATICNDLMGRDTGMVICECDDCVRNAVEVDKKCWDNRTMISGFKNTVVMLFCMVIIYAPQESLCRGLQSESL